MVKRLICLTSLFEIFDIKIMENLSSGLGPGTTTKTQKCRRIGITSILGVLFGFVKLQAT
jgi:hypothetical protein